MDRRTILALVLIAVVIVVTPRIFPVTPPSPATRADSTAGVPPLDTAPQRAVSASPVTATAPDSSRAAAPAAGKARPEAAPAETVSVGAEQVSVRLISTGAALGQVEMRGYRALGSRSGSVTLRGTGGVPLVRYRVVAGADTIPFDAAEFTLKSRSTTGAVTTVDFAGGVGADSLELRYTVRADSFLLRAEGRVTGPLAVSRELYVLASFAPTLESFEADTIDDHRHLAFAVEPVDKRAVGIGFGKLDPGERRVVPGPHSWAALRNKYFIVGILSPDTNSAIVEFSATGMARTSRIATQASGSALVRAQSGRFALDLYAGPQQWRRLQSVGRDFENSNPYGGFLQPVVQPFAMVVMRVLLWMRERLALGYGWVLVIFGVAIRLLLWPLNQTAMRTSLKMQRIQPELNDLQKRYKSDPQKLQSEMMRVYKEHGMSPFSMFSGCLPMLLPMPILFALFFVFQSTIEFRGVSFLWLADISQKDPYYILPILMGLSMYLLTWIGSKNAPPNPQTKMMGYIFPVMMTFLLANLASGLNLYYAVQNLSALPQQWLIASERARAAKPRGK